MRDNHSVSVIFQFRCMVPLVELLDKLVDCPEGFYYNGWFQRARSFLRSSQLYLTLVYLVSFVENNNGGAFVSSFYVDFRIIFEFFYGLTFGLG